VDRDIIKRLEGMLEKAKEGEIVSLAYAYGTPEGTFVRGVTFEESKTIYSIQGALTNLIQDLRELDTVKIT
jgi:hypothetical protein